MNWDYAGVGLIPLFNINITLLTMLNTQSMKTVSLPLAKLMRNDFYLRS